MRSLFFLLAGFVASSLACTTVMLKTAKDGCTVVGRTMELGIPLEKSELEQIYIHPRGTTVGTAHGTYNASKYGYLAVQFAVGSTTLRMATTEGINEAGLTVSAQVHMQASYEPSHNITRAVTLFDIQATAFLLGCCKTVAQAADALASVAVISTPLIGALGQLHWSVQDATGASRVFEYIDETLRVFDNTEVGVLTNDPSYEWQLGHLNLYADYPSAVHPPAFKFTARSSGPFSTSSVPVSGDGTRVTSTVVPQAGLGGVSHGYNTRGLPGGYTPPDRFVKMFLLKQAAVAHAPPQDLDDGLTIITGLLNTVHIVRGAVAGGGLLEYTNWACVKVPWGGGGNATRGGGAADDDEEGGVAGPIFYYRTYDNMQWKRIELSKLDFSAGSAYPPVPLFEAGLGVKDATPHKQATPKTGPGAARAH